MAHLQGLAHASADDQRVDPLLQHLLQVSRLDSWPMLWTKQRPEAGLLVFCFFFCMSVEMVLGSTHVSPGLSPVPGSAASRPNLTVLIAGGASFHLHVAPGERGDLGRRHVRVTPPTEGKKRKNKQQK